MSHCQLVRLILTQIIAQQDPVELMHRFQRFFLPSSTLEHNSPPLIYLLVPRGVREAGTAQSSCRGNAKHNNRALIPGNNTEQIGYRGRGCWERTSQTR